MTTQKNARVIRSVLPSVVALEAGALVRPDEQALRAIITSKGVMLGLVPRACLVNY